MRFSDRASCLGRRNPDLVEQQRQFFEYGAVGFPFVNFVKFGKQTELACNFIALKTGLPESVTQQPPALKRRETIEYSVECRSTFTVQSDAGEDTAKPIDSITKLCHFDGLSHMKSSFQEIHTDFKVESAIMLRITL